MGLIGSNRNTVDVSFPDCLHPVVVICSVGVKFYLISNHWPLYSPAFKNQLYVRHSADCIIPGLFKVNP